MKAGTFVLTALLAVICADNAAADRGHSAGHSSGHSGAAASAPAHVHVARPGFVAHPYAHAPLPHRIVAPPVVYYTPRPIHYRPALIYYVPPVAYYPPPVYYAPPVYPSGAYYPAPVAGDPQYYPPATDYIEQPPPVAQAPQGPDYLYFCPDTRLYYPAVAECASGWLRVVPDSGTIR
jgi:hypothetical protein